MSETQTTMRSQRRQHLLSWLKNADGKTSTALSALRSLALNFIAILAVAVSFPILVKELVNSPVIIAPISMPASIEATGLTGHVVANRLWDAWANVNREVTAAKETRDVLPTSQRITFAIPDSGLSFDSLIHHLRDFFGLDETTVSGEFVCSADPCTIETAALRLRVIDSGLAIVALEPVGTTPMDTYLRKAIAEVMLHVDPVRGIMATSLGNEERAIAELRKLVRANHPDRQWALVFAGVLLANRGQTTDAVASFDDALKNDPTFSLALAQRGNALLLAGKTEEARSAVAAALKLDPADARNHMQLAMIEASMGAYDKAIAAYEVAAKLQPNWPQVALGLGVVHYRRQDYLAAKKAYESAIAIDPDFIDARRLLALLASLEGDGAAALHHQQVIAAAQPLDAAAQSDLADALDLAGDLVGAESAYGRAISVSANKSLLFKKRGSVRQRQKRLDESLADFLQAAAIDPSLEDIWFAIGDAQFKLGRWRGARASFERYISQQPNGTYAAIAQAHLKSSALAQ